MDDGEVVFYADFGAWVRRKRTSMQLSRKQLGDLVGLSAGSITSIELGKQRPVLHQYALICEKLRCEPGTGMSLHLLEDYIPRRSRAGRPRLDRKSFS
jgi:transcriptional regulator with XRE-family HTH domain